SWIDRRVVRLSPQQLASRLPCGKLRVTFAQRLFRVDESLLSASRSSRRVRDVVALSQGKQVIAPSPCLTGTQGELCRLLAEIRIFRNSWCAQREHGGKQNQNQCGFHLHTSLGLGHRFEVGTTGALVWTAILITQR